MFKSRAKLHSQSQATRILIVDDEAPIRQVLQSSLQDDGHEVVAAADGPASLEICREWSPHIVLLDIWMPGEMDGLAVLGEIQNIASRPDVIMMSGHGNIETAVKATKLGAWDFVEKPLSIDRIRILIENIRQFQEEKYEKQLLINKLRSNLAIVGHSPALRDLKEWLARASQSSCPLLLSGESGSGKELVARNLHYLSSRAPHGFVEINCAAIPRDLFEMELLGFDKEAVAVAAKARGGKLEAADLGTLFFDEVSLLPLSVQELLVEFIDTQAIARVGSSQKNKVNVRLIAATNQDLAALVKTGQFREDLFQKINVMPFELPALRNRIDDLPALVLHFSSEFAKSIGVAIKTFSDAALKFMGQHRWSGNVRELRNFIERVYILTPGTEVTVPDLFFAGLAMRMPSDVMDLSASVSFREARQQFERDFILQKISENEGNISKTAELIGLERSHLHRKIKAFGIDV